MSVAVQNHFVNKSLGDWSGGDTPGNIPNPAVKSASADGTWRATSWESRSLPGDFSFNISAHGLFLCALIVYNNPVGSVEGHDTVPFLSKEECEAHVLIHRSLCRFVLPAFSPRPSIYRPIFYWPFPCGKEVTCFGICKFT
jgi:hypothetical protein